MPLVCPACGKRYESTVVPACDRCGCDLSRLQEIVLAAAALLRMAKAAFERGDWHAGQSFAERSWELAHSEQAAGAVCLAAAALSDGATLEEWRRRATRQRPR